MLVLGIDTGSSKTGWAVVQLANSTATYVCGGWVANDQLLETIAGPMGAIDLVAIEQLIYQGARTGKHAFAAAEMARLTQGILLGLGWPVAMYTSPQWRRGLFNQHNAKEHTVLTYVGNKVRKFPLNMTKKAGKVHVADSCCIAMWAGWVAQNGEKAIVQPRPNKRKPAA